jgi:SAM-dependent methyltransferase
MTAFGTPEFPRTNGERFAARRMAENYQYRPPYSAELYDILLGLIRDRPRTVLDAGCGPGKISREIVHSVDRIDAVDPSAEMIRVGGSLAGGNNPKLRWLNGRIEDVALTPPYSLIVAGASFHWMNPAIALRRFSEVISPGGMFVVLAGDAPIDPPWDDEERDIAMDLATRIEGTRPKWWATAKDNLSRPLVDHRQFSPVGSKITAPMEFTQSVANYLRCLHSRASFSQEYLGEELSSEFDRAIAGLLSRYAVDDVIKYRVQSRLDWGRPLPG